MRMIYYLAIIDVSSQTGVCKWDFIHPDTHEELFEHLKSVIDYIPPMTYGIVSVVSKELFGDQLRRMEFSEMQIIIGKLTHGDKDYYVIFLADIKDHPKAVWRIFNKFYEEEKPLFDKVLAETPVDIEDLNRLRSAFAAFLVDHFRKNPLLGARDTKSFIVSLLLSTAIMGILVGISWLINHIYHLVDQAETWLAYIYMVLIMNFIMPGPFIGYFTQYRKHAEAVSLINGFLWASITSMIYHAPLIAGLKNTFGIEVGAMEVALFTMISGGIYGAVLALISAVFAVYFEHRKLTCPRIIPIRGIEKAERTALESRIQIPEPTEQS